MPKAKKKTTRKKVQKKVVKAKGKAKHPGGAPRTVTPKTYTKTQLQKINEMALDQCQNTTIAVALGINVDTFRRQFESKTEQKRAEGKAELLHAQRERAITDKSDTMLIWKGKQHLDQKDKQEVDHGVTDAMGELMRELDGTAYNPGNSQPSETEST